MDRCDPKADLERFIDEKGTGPLIPGKLLYIHQSICLCLCKFLLCIEPPVYVDYFDDPTKTLPKFQIANFAENDSSKSSKSTCAPPAADELQYSAINQQPVKSSSTTTTSRRSSSILQSDLSQRDVTRHSSVKSNSLKSKPLPPERDTDDMLVAKLTEHRVNLYSKPDFSKIKKPAPAKNSNGQPDVPVTDDEVIDPRAQIMFSVGGNVFPVNHGEPQETVKRRLSKRMSNGRKMDDLNTSIRGLLQELGVVDDKGNQKKSEYQTVTRQSSLTQSTSLRRVAAASTAPFSKMQLKEPVLAWGK